MGGACPLPFLISGGQFHLSYMGETRPAGSTGHVGIRNQTAAYGVKANRRSRQNGPNGTQPALGSTAAYVGKRDKKCSAKDDTCNGWRALGSPFCTLHLKALGKLGEWQERAKQLKALKSEQTSDELE